MDYGYTGSVDLVRKRLAELRPRMVRPAQKTAYRPGQVMQVDWAEMPTRPRVLGRERRVYALICTLPFSGASTAHFTFDMTIESFLQGHVKAFDWLGGVPRECVYDNLRTAVAKRERIDGTDVIRWNPRFSQLRGHYAFHAHRVHARGHPGRRGRWRAAFVITRPGSGQRDGSATSPSLMRSTRDGVTGLRCHAGTRPAGISSLSAWQSSERH